MLWTRRLCLLTLALLSAACSSASYVKPAEQLATGIAEVRTTFDQLRVDRVNMRQRELTLTLLEPGASMRRPQICKPIGEHSAPPQGNCVFTIASKLSASETALDVPDRTPKGTVLVTGLDQYGAGLVALARAGDTAELQAGVHEAAAGLANFASLFGPMVAIPARVAAEAASFTFGKVSDARRLDTLRKVVCESNPLVRDAAVLLAQEMRNLQGYVLEGQAVLIGAERLALQKAAVANRPAIAAHIVEMALSAKTYADTDLAASTSKMAVAHAALCDALRRPNVSPADAIGAMTAFTAEAARVATIFKPSAGGK